jgi:cytochrome c556
MKKHNVRYYLIISLKNIEVCMKYLIILCLLISNQVFSEDFRALSLERKQAFTNIEDNLERVIDSAESSEIKWDEMDLISQDLNEDIQFLKQSFPENSYNNTRARERIWSNFKDFEQRLNGLAGSINNIEKSVKNKDKRALIESWDSAGNACNACHRRYRTFW